MPDVNKKPASGSTQDHSSSAGQQQTSSSDRAGKRFNIEIPTVSLPKGGGAIQSIDEKFEVNAVNGSASFSIPFPSRTVRGFGVDIGLSYNSAAGNGIFGLGWSLNLPSVKRKTEQELPQYLDFTDSDTYLFSGQEDLVPRLEESAGSWAPMRYDSPDGLFLIQQYRPRIEGSFARIERWIKKSDGDIHWRITSKDNLTTILGDIATSRIADPLDNSRIFEWLPRYTFDDRGNCSIYEYKAEDGAGIDASLLHNQNRVNGNAPFSNVYLKRIRSGNTKPFNGAELPPVAEFMFEMVFDYGEHDPVNAPFNIVQPWRFRADAFSTYKSGFDIRTCRLCNRVLFYHHFSELPGGSALVNTLSFQYDDNGQSGNFTFLREVTATGFIKHSNNSYTQKSLPPLSFDYQSHEWNKEIRNLSTESLEHLTAGINGKDTQWIDLYSEGLAGMLTEQAGALYYKQNLGDGRFAPAKLVTPKPVLTGLGSHIQVSELEGDGVKYLTTQTGPVKGFFKMDDEGFWEALQTFEQLPNINFDDPNLRQMDVNGDGISDLLISGDGFFTWYLSLGEKGFDAARQSLMDVDEEKGPRLVFSSQNESIYLSDFNGDGLIDIVSISNGSVFYWPNLGHGKFGSKVSMDNAPWFDHPDQFDPKYLRLADIDGSGTTDLIYLGKDLFRVWLNQSGNAFLPNPVVIDPFPEIHEMSQVSVMDLLGSGTSCIVWSSPLQKDQQQSLKYIDLMNSRKPHVMIGYRNNIGKEIELQYTPSTRFFLDDRLNGEPWITKLPFTVQCLSKVVKYDRIMKTRFATEYSYHHGYYDHIEKEFRGFGRVHQLDAEDIVHFKKESAGAMNNTVQDDLHQYPVLYKSWFHTGAFAEGKKILNQYAHEYFQNPIHPENILQDASFENGLSANDWREGLRCCKGRLLRKEVYALDQTANSKKPYSVEQHNYAVKMLQPGEHNQFASFLVLADQSITYHYDRNPADPRVAHGFTLESDAYGNVLQSVTLVYPRKAPVAGNPPHAPEQLKLYATFSENSFTNKVETPLDYRLPLLYQSKLFELHELPLPAGSYYTSEEIKNALALAGSIDYHVQPNGALQKRIVDFSRLQFKANDGISSLPFGTLASKALVHQSFTATFNTAHLLAVFGPKVNIATLSGLLTDVTKSGYVMADNYFWMPSAIVQYDSGNFYLPVQYTDPFGNRTLMQYDANYHLFIEKATDAFNSTTTVVQFNYRALNPAMLKDSNDDLSATRYNELGIPTSVFVIGKKSVDPGDEYDDTSAEASPNDHPSVEMEYNIFEWYNQSNQPAFDPANDKPQPCFIRIKKRTKHYHADPVHATTVEESYIYFNGSGAAVMKKMQAEPGPAIQMNPDGSVGFIPDTSPNLRWVGNGRTILNNKGNPVKEYEPYFSTTPSFDDEKEMVELGVSPIIHYDPLGRVTHTDYPNRSFAKIELTPWTQRNFDPNDTVMESEWYALRVTTPDPVIATPEQVDAAQKAAAHANSPVTSHLDTLGRTFYTEADNVVDTITSRLKLDIEGKEIEVIDPMNRVAMRYEYDMAGRAIKQVNMDAGTRWLLADVSGNALISWDERDHEFTYEYDALRRPTHFYVRIANGVPLLHAKVEYGESIVNVANAKANNQRGKIFRRYDQSGVFTAEKYDFKGNLQQSSKQLVADYKNTIDWSAVAAPGMEADLFGSETAYDALNRPVKIIAPHTPTMKVNEIYPSYNAAGLLDRVEVKISSAAVTTPFVTNINYDAKGQREEISYANGTRTKYRYDRETLRLINLKTTRNADAVVLQDLFYTYDPAGNITLIKDLAHADIFFDGEQVRAINDYTYDAIYRLKIAKGRKHAGQTDVQSKGSLGGNTSSAFHPFQRSVAINPNDANAFRNYTESYTYDRANNMTEQKHLSKNSSWARTFVYDHGNDLNNRLTKTSIAGDDYDYTYDAHGNMYGLETLLSETWNFMDQLKEADLGGGGTVYYVYDDSGNRARKVVERQGGLVQERIYLSGVEIYRERNNGAVVLERETLHVMDDQRRIAMIETPVIKPAGSAEAQLIRFQYDNHLGSASIELDNNAQVISYEEYFPFGTSSFSTIDATREVARKRYRYTGKERDEESGLNSHGVRYYAPWLCRWTSADLSGMIDGANLFNYTSNNPVVLNDPSGRSGEETKQVKPFVKDLLDKYGIKYAEEVEFEMVTKGGDKVKGKFDLVIIDPKTKKHVPIELKGLDPDAFSTKGQELYIKEFETPKGADIKITGKKGGSLALPKGSKLTVADDSFLRVWKGNMNDFADAVAQQTGGKKIKHKYYDPKDGWKFFDNEADFHKYCKEKGIDPVKPSKQAEKAAQEAKDKAEREAALKARKEAQERAKKELQDKLEREAKEKLAKEAAEKGTKWGLKRLGSFVPVGGAVMTILLAPADASAAETGLRAVASEVGIGPVDAELVYDASTFMLEETGANEMAFKKGMEVENAAKKLGLDEDVARGLGATTAAVQTLNYVLFPPSILIDKIFD